MTVNSERTKIYTDYCRSHENEYPLLKRSGALLEWAKTRQCNVFDDDIIVGTPGPDERSLSPYVDLDCRWIPECEKEKQKQKNKRSRHSVLEIYKHIGSSKNHIKDKRKSLYQIQYPQCHHPPAGFIFG